MVSTFCKTLILCSLTSIVFFASSGQAKVLERIYAVVNGEIITLTEIKDYQNKLKNGGFINDLLFSDPEERKRALESREYLVKRLVDEKIIDFEVKQHGLQVTEERVDKEISTIASRQNLNIQQLRRTLEAQSVDYSEYRDFVKSSIERRQLVEKEITSKIKISEQDIVSHYLANNSAGKSQVFSFTLAHILWDPQQKDEAQAIAKKIKNGEPFEAMVKKHSRDDDSKAKAGLFGEFNSGEMVQSIQSAIENLKVGQTSSVVSTPMGLHVFKVLDKKLVKDPAIENQKQALYQQLFAQAFKEQLNFWLTQKRKDAIIQINKS